MTSKVTVSLLKSEICCNLFPHSKYIFTHVHTFASLSLDSLREHTELSIEFHETWTEFCREEEAAGPRAHAGSRPGGRQAGSGWVSHKEASGRKRSILLRNPSVLLLLTHWIYPWAQRKPEAWKPGKKFGTILLALAWAFDVSPWHPWWPVNLPAASDVVTTMHRSSPLQVTPHDSWKFGLYNIFCPNYVQLYSMPEYPFTLPGSKSRDVHCVAMFPGLTRSFSLCFGALIFYFQHYYFFLISWSILQILVPANDPFSSTWVLTKLRNKIE